MLDRVEDANWNLRKTDRLKSARNKPSKVSKLKDNSHTDHSENSATVSSNVNTKEISKEPSSLKQIDLVNIVSFERENFVHCRHPPGKHYDTILWWVGFAFSASLSRTFSLGALSSWGEEGRNWHSFCLSLLSLCYFGPFLAHCSKVFVFDYLYVLLGPFLAHFLGLFLLDSLYPNWLSCCSFSLLNMSATAFMFTQHLLLFQLLSCRQKEILKCHVTYPFFIY